MIEEWETKEAAEPDEGMLVAEDPLTQKQITVALTSFADDVARMKHIKNEEDLKNKQARSNQIFDEALRKKAMAQNHGKQEVLIRLFGKGAQKRYRRLHKKDENLVTGKITNKTKYVGGTITVDDDMREEATQRINDMEMNWKRMGAFWRSGDSGHDTKVTVFNSIIGGTARAGGVACVYPESQTTRIDKKRVMMARRILKKKGFKKFKDENQDATEEEEEQFGDKQYVAKSARAVRRMMKFHTTESELQTERMRAARHQILNPDEYEQLRTAMFSQFPFEEQATLTLDGCTTDYANPWAKQWEQDVTAMFKEAGAKYEGLFDTARMEKAEEVTDEHIKKFLQRESERERKDREKKEAKETQMKNQKMLTDAGGNQVIILTDQNRNDEKEGDQWVCKLRKEDGGECGQVFSELRGFRVHQCRTHKVLHYERCRVICNQCCYCEKIYKETSYAQRHVQQTLKGVEISNS